MELTIEEDLKKKEELEHFIFTNHPLVSKLLQMSIPKSHIVIEGTNSVLIKSPFSLYIEKLPKMRECHISVDNIISADSRSSESYLRIYYKE